MKNVKIWLVVHLVGAAWASGQTSQSRTDGPTLMGPTVTKLEVVTGSLMPSAVRFTPPPAPEAMPVIPLEASSSVDKGTHQITLQRGAPSTLPDIPPPPVRVETTSELSFEPQPANFFLGLSVTIYDRSLSHLKWQDPETKQKFEAWCRWDWSLVAPMQEVSNEQVSYRLFFSPYHIDTTKVHFGRRLEIPDHPALVTGEFEITQGDSAARAGRPLLEAVQRYCTDNRTSLELIRAAREQYRADAAAWKKENPSQPRSHTIALRPHRGSRYLEGNRTQQMKEGGEAP